jgi:hypothetical protein
VIRTVLVLLGGLLLSSWFSSGIGVKAMPVGSLAHHPEAGFRNSVERRTQWVNTLCPMDWWANSNGWN